MEHRIYFSVCGEGYGHSSRAISIAKKLESAGARIMMGSYGYALERLKTFFPAVNIKKEFEMVAKDGAFDLKATLLQSKTSALNYSGIISGEKKAMEDFSATCVVSDGRIAPVLAAFKLGLPCVVISNQTSIESFFRESSFLVHLLGKPVEFSLKTSMELAEVVLIPDFPPPHTVCLDSLSKSRHVMKKQVFTGPIVAEKYENPGIEPDVKNPCVMTVLSGHEFSIPVFNGILSAAHRFPEVEFIIFAKFKSENIPQNVRLMGFREDLSSYMNSSDLIITQAGHSTAMEIMTIGKPALIIPIKGQIEQQNNAARLKALGICETLDYQTLDPENFYSKINSLLTDMHFRDRSRFYSEMALNMKGSRTAAEIILGLSGRIQCY